MDELRAIFVQAFNHEDAPMLEAVQRAMGSDQVAGPDRTGQPVVDGVDRGEQALLECRRGDKALAVVAPPSASTSTRSVNVPPSVCALPSRWSQRTCAVGVRGFAASLPLSLLHRRDKRFSPYHTALVAYLLAEVPR